MVDTITIEKYKCPYCCSTYDTLADAEDCTQDCHSEDIEDVIEDFDETYICVMCNKTHGTFLDAEKCEEKHRKNDDKFMFWYTDRIQKEKLLKAGFHPQQTQLMVLLSN